MKKPVFLIGFMGCGKTSTAKKLASSMDVDFIDLDQKITDIVGMTIPDFFREYGELKFRELERETLHFLRDIKAIISTGGGAPCFFDNMVWMVENGTVIYLKHSSKSLFDRLSASKIEERPLLKGLSGDELYAYIENTLKIREPYYSQADCSVNQISTSIDDLRNIIHELQ